MRRWWLAVGLLGLLAGCGSGGDSGGTGGAVAGYVFVRNGTLVLRANDEPAAGEVPAVGALVSITSGGLGFTAADGSYRITGIDPGTRELRVDYEGSLPVTVNVTVVAGQTTLVGSGGGVPQSRRWTVMVYLDADHANESAAIAALNAMERVGSSDAVTIDVLMDRAAGFDSSNGNWTGARRFRVVQDSDPNQLVSSRLTSEGGAASDEGEMNLGDAAVLRQFIISSRTTYPATRYCLIIWSSGSGWRADQPIAGRAVAADQSSADLLTIPELELALQSGQDLDLTVLDAPYLSFLETVYQIQDETAYVVASQSGLPVEGLPYETILGQLATAPTTSAADLAELFVDESIESFDGRYEASLSAVRSSGVDAVADALEDYTQILRPLAAANHETIVTARDAAQGFGAGTAAYFGFRDLVSLTSGISTAVNSGSLITASLQLRDAVTNALVTTRRTGSTMDGARGLSLYLPDFTDYEDPGSGGLAPTKDAYEDLALSTDTHWDEFIEEFVDRQD